MSSDEHKKRQGDLETPHAGARANAYHVLARALDRPADWEPDLPDLLRSSFQASGDGLEALAAWLASRMDESLSDRESVSVAHARLFIGPFEIQAPPYASLFLDPNRRLMGDVSLEAADAYSEAGLGPNRERREAPDHVVLELEFMYFLAFQAATTGGDVWLDRQRRFWRSHLGRWLPRFAVTMKSAAAHPYYDVLADLLLTFSTAEQEVLGRGTAAD